ncbi:hypothetical protein F5Y16DRAFT_417233 [Xylariaceae sp. FL0255]|nr:hypothetical protein F5Y16DRAFT_417233 [Xylariaceae sp. FL0255]
MNQLNFEAAFEKFLAGDYDNYSTRAWLTLKANPALTYGQTVSGETSDTLTGLFNLAWAETICGYTDFAAAKGVPWWRIEGRMSALTDAMEHKVNQGGNTVTLNTAVVGMSDNGETIGVVTKDKAGARNVTQYNMVFNTTAMPPLQRMDLQGLNLPDPILTGIRTLSYDRATKVAVKFSTPWWNDLGLPIGGISGSDLPISNCVYPSWNDGTAKNAMLLCSYSWAQDVTRMAALVPDYTKVTPSIDDPVIDLCLHNLVKLWSGYPKGPSY